jgi:Na+-transporting methylmalonyl-CoA/oxaloacetate decarboxylase gamma subunit
MTDPLVTKSSSTQALRSERAGPHPSLPTTQATGKIDTISSFFYQKNICKFLTLSILPYLIRICSRNVRRFAGMLSPEAAQPEKRLNVILRKKFGNNSSKFEPIFRTISDVLEFIPVCVVYLLILFDVENYENILLRFGKPS